MIWVDDEIIAIAIKEKVINQTAADVNNNNKDRTNSVSNTSGSHKKIKDVLRDDNTIVTKDKSDLYFTNISSEKSIKIEVNLTDDENPYSQNQEVITEVIFYTVF